MTKQLATARVIRSDPVTIERLRHFRDQQVQRLVKTDKRNPLWMFWRKASLNQVINGLLDAHYIELDKKGKK